MSLAETIEAAEVVDGVRVVWDSRDKLSGTRLEIEPAPLNGFRARMQDRAGTCITTWMPDSTEVDVARQAIDAYLAILD